ncbi:hypothetical protein Nepgr_017883 [Nepenthes gracilis]|uniref:VWFA domain-containing protein n=1 Tax=Nepenthes gracilis TaxID=150966 RepID=A0AAD3SRZ6_NEPGR|nr:hypothetical protein Nepgr_017883 [Nepenthes gracilis]
MDAQDFTKSVEMGLKLSKRISYGRCPSMKAPKPPSMESYAESFIPVAPMVYAVISDPSIVDNPDIPSYQPYVHGRCSPPALIPLHMHGIQVEVDCHLDTAFVTVSGTWRVHCVSGSKSSDCCIAVPMGEQGSILGFEVEVMRGSYHSQLIMVEDAVETEGLTKTEVGCLLKPSIYTLKIPKVDGGCKLSVKARWSQKLLFYDGQFCLHLPFSFPPYVTPAGKISKREKIWLNVSCGTETEVICRTTSHPLKELRRQAGKLDFLYEAEAYTWSHSDFKFSYSVSKGDIFGGLLLQSPSLHDFDQREMFCFYLFPGNIKNREIFRKRVVFLVDISGSMRGAPIENVKKALVDSLTKLNPLDSFNILAFNEEANLFSSSMKLATQEAIQSATQWIDLKFIAEGSTNIFRPLNQAIEMLSKESDSMSFIFLITDGAVENERVICNVVRGHLAEGGLLCPRISTFGIGSYCNHYFLQTLAQIGRGHYDAAYDIDSIAPRLQSLYEISSSVILANVDVECLEHLNSITLYPSRIEDLSCGSPLFISGRYSGAFPESVKVSGTLADMSNFVLCLKTQKAKDVSLDRVFKRRQIDILTGQAWWLESKQLEEEVAKMSIQAGVPSEYTRSVLVQTDSGKQASNSIFTQEKQAAQGKFDLRNMAGSCKKMMLLSGLGVGFGDPTKTAENMPAGIVVRTPDATERLVNAASKCCHRVVDRCCCLCFINVLSNLNDQCAIVASQLCAALACSECIKCCFDLYFSCS